MSAVNYERRGTGPALVLLHGIGHRWQAWTPVLDLLAARYTVYALDLPGFGASPLPAGGLPDGMRSAVDALAQALTELGWSDRTWPGTAWAARWPWSWRLPVGPRRPPSSRRPVSTTGGRGGWRWPTCARCGC